MAEQRLAQRAELSQERQQHITDLTQVHLPQAHVLAYPPLFPCTLASLLPLVSHLLTFRQQASSVTLLCCLNLEFTCMPVIKACSSTAWSQICIQLVHGMSPQCATARWLLLTGASHSSS